MRRIDIKNEMRREISIAILKHAAEVAGVTFEEYCSVYDSESHENVINTIMKKLQTYNAQTEKFDTQIDLEARLDEVKNQALICDYLPRDPGGFANRKKRIEILTKQLDELKARKYN
jgi:hypothetical protein